MTNKADLASLNLAVAELIGWEVPDHVRSKTGKEGSPPDFGKNPANGKWENIPNYASDLNLMHEAEKTLTHEQCVSFHEALDRILATDSADESGEVEYPADAFWFHATAEQRARALLATLNPKTP